MHWAIGYDKPFSWIGKRALTRPDTARTDRKQLVGLKPRDPKVVLEEGAQIVFDPDHAIPMPMKGHVTSSYYSPTLDSGFALAVVKGGQQRMGETVYLRWPTARSTKPRSSARSSSIPRESARMSNIVDDKVKTFDTRTEPRCR